MCERSGYRKTNFFTGENVNEKREEEKKRERIQERKNIFMYPSSIILDKFVTLNCIIVTFFLLFRS